jgi:ribosomal protein S27E
MARETPAICRGALARLSLSLAQIIFALGCLGAVIGGVVLVGVGISRGDIVFALVSVAGAAIEFILSFAFFVVLTAAKHVLFPQESGEEPTAAIQCENGHNVSVTSGQAGSSIPCSICGSNINVPALSELQGNA